MQTQDFDSYFKIRIPSNNEINFFEVKITENLKYLTYHKKKIKLKTQLKQNKNSKFFKTPNFLPIFKSIKKIGEKKIKLTQNTDIKFIQNHPFKKAYTKLHIFFHIVVSCGWSQLLVITNQY